MEDAARRHGGRPKLGPAGGGVDLISALPEDLLLQVLVRLRCARAAARTSLLSRRWRGLWIRLPDLTFRDVALVSLLPVLASVETAVGPGPAGVFLLDIRVPAARLFPGDKIDLAQLNERISSLFHTASRISPVELRLALPRIVEVHVDLPRFHRATSIELQAPSLRLTRPPRARGGFPALKRLSLSHCRVDLADFVAHCPCLRVLSVSNAGLDADNITVRSESLEELAVVNPYRWDDRIDIEAPMLKQLTLSFCTGTKLSVSIMAPILEKVSWGCFYSVVPVGLGPWGLWKVSLHAAESHGQRVLADTGEDACLQLSNVYVLSLQIWAYGLDRYPDAELNFAQEIEKHLVTDFSVLELHFMTMGPEYRIRSVGHVFGAFVVHLLGMHQIRTATRKLKVILQRSEMIKEECPVNCPCDVPNNWRSKNISLINLEEVEIEGFDGEDHEFDFLKVMFRCAPMLKRMAVRMSDEVRTSEDQCSKIYDIFQAYPFVECNVDLSSGSKHSNQGCASA